MTTQVTAARQSDQTTWQVYFPRLLAAQFIASLGFGFASPFMPLFIQQLSSATPGEAAFWTGMISALNGPVMFMAGPIWGVLSDWIGHKKMVLRATFGAMTFMILTGIVQTLPQLLLVRTLMGAVTGVFPAINGLAASIVPKGRLPFTVGLLQGVNSVGNTIGPVVGGIFVAWLGYRWGFTITGIIIGAAGLLVFFGVRERFHARQNIHRTPAGLVKETGEMLALPGMKRVLFMMSMIQFAPNLVYPVYALFLISLDPEAGVVMVGVAFTIMGLTQAASAWGSALLSNRFSFKPLMLAGCAASVAGAVLMAIAGSIAIALVSMALLGVGLGLVTTRASAIVGEVAPSDRQGSAFGILQSANAIGFGFGPLVGGIVANSFGLRMPFLIEAIAFAFLALYIMRLRLKRVEV